MSVAHDRFMAAFTKRAQAAKIPENLLGAFQAEILNVDPQEFSAYLQKQAIAMPTNEGGGGLANTGVMPGPGVAELASATPQPHGAGGVRDYVSRLLAARTGGAPAAAPVGDSPHDIPGGGSIPLSPPVQSIGNVPADRVSAISPGEDTSVFGIPTGFARNPFLNPPGPPLPGDPMGLKALQSQLGKTPHVPPPNAVDPSQVQGASATGGVKTRGISGGTPIPDEAALAALADTQSGGMNNVGSPMTPDPSKGIEVPPEVPASAAHHPGMWDQIKAMPGQAADWFQHAGPAAQLGIGAGAGLGLGAGAYGLAHYLNRGHDKGKKKTRK